MSKIVLKAKIKTSFMKVHIYNSNSLIIIHLIHQASQYRQQIFRDHHLKVTDSFLFVSNWLSHTCVVLVWSSHYWLCLMSPPWHTAIPRLVTHFWPTITIYWDLDSTSQVSLILEKHGEIQLKCPRSTADCCCCWLHKIRGRRTMNDLGYLSNSILQRSRGIEASRIKLLEIFIFTF